MKCSACSRENRDNARFCSQCGKQLGATSNLPQTSQQLTPTLDISSDDVHNHAFSKLLQRHSLVEGNIKGNVPQEIVELRGYVADYEQRTEGNRIIRFFILVCTNPERSRGYVYIPVQMAGYGFDGEIYASDEVIIRISRPDKGILLVDELDNLTRHFTVRTLDINQFSKRSRNHWQNCNRNGETIGKVWKYSDTYENGVYVKHITLVSKTNNGSITIPIQMVGYGFKGGMSFITNDTIIIPGEWNRNGIMRVKKVYHKDPEYEIEALSFDEKEAFDQWPTRPILQRLWAFARSLLGKAFIILFVLLVLFVLYLVSSGIDPFRLFNP